MFCKKCGHKRVNGEKFCPVCGTPFPEDNSNQEAPNMTSMNQTAGKRSHKKVMMVIGAVIILLWLFFSWVNSSGSSSDNDTNTEVSSDGENSGATQSSENGAYGPDWLHGVSFIKYLPEGGKCYIRFEADGTFKFWVNSNDDQSTIVSSDGRYTVSGENVTITLNDGKVMNYTLNEGNQSVVSSSGAEFTQVE